MENEFKDTEIGKIPVDWEVSELKVVTENIFSGGTPDTRKPEYWNGDIPWLSSGETRNTYIENTEKKITQKGVENSSTRMAKKEDIVIASAGQGYTRGQAAFCKIDTYVNQSIVVIRAKKEILNPLFLYYNIKLRYNELRAISDSHSSRGSLTTKLLAPLKIPLPPIEEQQKIAEILSALDDKIENNNLQNKILEETANSIFKEWFVNFNFLDENGKPYLENGGEMEFNEELGVGIPKGWSFDELTEFGKIVCGKTPSKSVDEYFCGETPFIKIPDMHNKMFLVKTEDSLTEKGVQSQKNKVIPANSVCVSCIATVGLVSMTVKESQTNQQINSIIPKNDNLTMYLYFTLKSMTEYIKILASGGSATLNLNTTEFSKIKIIMPEKDILEKYYKEIMPLKNKILKNETENILLSNLRDLLLPKLMGGQIRLK
ncbi:restriction endonuclease subunit S [Methanococcus maripaludis]|uniref:Restriction endonuclease subunit S n=1 Tax=Methanococcus maripaludis TaxID=39152 RepID=A0A8T3VUU1_METMI|nr:restriction endonuclease subunit S [Methanococcus maripaludis]MBG0768336.1 restriction endonuclease subunit S [Methanococcus maripaludis]